MVDVTLRLDTTGVDNWHTPLVIYGDVWNDNNDATYAPLSYVVGTELNARGYLDPYVGGYLISVVLRFRASASGAASPQPIVCEFDRSAGGHVVMFYGGSSLGRNSDPSFWGAGANFEIPTDDTIRDYSATVDAHTLSESGWDNLDEIREDLTDGGGWLYFWADDYLSRPPSPTGSVKIYEAWLEITTGVIRNLVINPSGEQSFDRAWIASNGTVETNVTWMV